MLIGKKVSVGTTAVDLLSGVDVDKPLEVFIRHESLGVDILLGDSSVTSTNGYFLNRGDIQPLRLTLRNSELYAVSTAGTGDLYVLVVGL